MNYLHTLMRMNYLGLLCILLMSPVFVQVDSSSIRLILVAEAQTTTADTDIEAVQATATATSTAENISNQRQSVLQGGNLTQPDELEENEAITSLFASRQVTEPTVYNIAAYWVQESVRSGVPVNTIFLILLTPFLALLVSFTRIVIGLPTLDMLVPIALAFALVAVGVTAGLLVLTAILIASYISKKILSRVRIMFYPKRSLSMAFLAIAVFAALTLGVALEFERILSVSIFPILVMMLLGDMIVSVQLHKSSYETFLITTTTILIGLIGYAAATSTAVQNMIILYPELVLLVIPANLLIGRYFGLRMLELLRFSKVDVD